MGFDDKVENKGEELKGQAKEAAGAVTGDDELKNEGTRRPGRVLGQAGRREGQGRRRRHQGRVQEVVTDVTPATMRVVRAALPHW